MRFDFALEKKKQERYTHRDPNTGMLWDDILGKWVEEPEKEKETIDDQNRES